VVIAVVAIEEASSFIVGWGFPWGELHLVGLPSFVEVLSFVDWVAYLLDIASLGFLPLVVASVLVVAWACLAWLLVVNTIFVGLEHLWVLCTSSFHLV